MAPVGEFNGRNLLLPAGVTEDQFGDLVHGLKQPDLVEYGNGAPQFGNGDPFTVDQFSGGLFHHGARLRSRRGPDDTSFISAGSATCSAPTAAPMCSISAPMREAASNDPRRLR